MAVSFVIFLSTFLRLGLWHGIVRMMIGVWMVAQLTLIAVAVIDPRLAATFARLSFLAIGGVGGLFTVFLALKGQDRALSLVPTWVLLLVWIFATGMTLSGRMSGDIVVASLIAGSRSGRHPDGLHGHPVCIPIDRYGLCRRADGTAGTISGARGIRLDGLGMEYSPRRNQGRPGGRDRACR